MTSHPAAYWVGFGLTIAGILTTALGVYLTVGDSLSDLGSGESPRIGPYGSRHELDRYWQRSVAKGDRFRFIQQQLRAQQQPVQAQRQPSSRPEAQPERRWTG